MSEEENITQEETEIEEVPRSEGIAEPAATSEAITMHKRIDGDGDGDGDRDGDGDGGRDGDGDGDGGRDGDGDGEEKVSVKRGAHSQSQRIHMDAELYNAASKGNIIHIEKLLINDASKSCLQGVTYGGDTALHVATRFGHFHVARKIYEKNTSLLIMVNDKKETPLHYAAQIGNLQLVNYFITRGGHGEASSHELLRKQNTEGETALYQAVHHQHKQVVAEMVNAAPHLASIPSSKQISPLYLATMLGSHPIVTSLIGALPTKGAPRGAYSGPDGQTALHAAARSEKQPGFVELILKWKPELANEIDNSGYTPLHYAASDNNYTAAKLLLECDRSSAYKADSSGLCPLHIAAKSDHLAVIIELFKHCPDSAELLDRQGRNFIHLAVEEKRETVLLWVCRHVTEFEKEIKAQDEQGDTPLHLAVKTRNPNLVCYLLLTRRVPLNWPNNKDLTPLDIAHEQMKEGSPSVQNPDYVIHSTLREIGCSRHKRRQANNLELDASQQKGNEKETKSEMEKNGKEKEITREMEKNDKEKEIKRDADNCVCESMACLVIGSVLIALATITAFYQVHSLYEENNHGKVKLVNYQYLNVVFEVFFLVDAFAFLCAIIATGLLVKATLNFPDPEYRKTYLLHCSSLVMMAVRNFIIAFTIEAYLVLAHVHTWLAILIYVMGFIATFLIPPRPWQIELVAITLMRYKVGTRSSSARFSPIVSRWVPLGSNFLYILFMAAVLFGGLTTPRVCHALSKHFIGCYWIIWVFVVPYLVVNSWNLLRISSYPHLACYSNQCYTFLNPAPPLANRFSRHNTYEEQGGHKNIVRKIFTDRFSVGSSWKQFALRIAQGYRSLRWPHNAESL